MRLALAALLLAAAATSTSPGGCGSGGIWGSVCSAENTGSQVDVTGVLEGPGVGAVGDRFGEAGDEPVVPGVGCVVGPGELCRGNYGTAGLPDVSLVDLASFRPAAPGLVSEPAGVGVAGLPVNLVSSVPVHTAVGELFGYAVSVRFSPVGFVFDHGDGTSSRSGSGGVGWVELGQASFTPTETSHVYRERGVYSASVTVAYAAEVNFGSRWREVPGMLELTSEGYPIRVVQARTALVEHTCTETPTAPGC